MHRFTIAAAVAALSLAASAEEAQTPPQTPGAATVPGWMAGCWQQVEGERWTEECWTIPRHVQMLGSGRTGTGDRVSSFEFMRIERTAGGLVFHGGPRGQGWTEFAGGGDEQGGMTFANPAHDFPQRVRYWREGDLLRAEVSLANGTGAQQWSFTRLGE